MWQAAEWPLNLHPKNWPSYPDPSQPFQHPILGLQYEKGDRSSAWKVIFSFSLNIKAKKSERIFRIGPWQPIHTLQLHVQVWILLQFVILQYIHNLSHFDRLREVDFSAENHKWNPSMLQAYQSLCTYMDQLDSHQWAPSKCLSVLCQ